jgi:hypothetical protein
MGVRCVAFEFDSVCKHTKGNDPQAQMRARTKAILEGSESVFGRDSLFRS